MCTNVSLPNEAMNETQEEDEIMTGGEGRDETKRTLLSKVNARPQQNIAKQRSTNSPKRQTVTKKGHKEDPITIQHQTPFHSTPPPVSAYSPLSSQVFRVCCLLFILLLPPLKGGWKKNSLKAWPKYGNCSCFCPTVDTVTSPFQLPLTFPRSRFLPAGATNLNKSKSPDNVHYTPTYSAPITVFVRGNAQSIHRVRSVEGNTAQNTVQH